MIKVLCVFCRLHIYNIEEGAEPKAENFKPSDKKHVPEPRPRHVMCCPHCKKQFFLRTPRGIKVLTEDNKLYPGGQDLEELLREHAGPENLTKSRPRR